MEKKAVERVPVVKRFSLLGSRQLFQNKATAAANASTKLSTIHSLTSLPLIHVPLIHVSLTHVSLIHVPPIPTQKKSQYLQKQVCPRNTHCFS